MFNYKWFLSDGFPASGIVRNNKTVFSMFSCGGGSTMGYKLAGFTHLGGCEIDQKIGCVYIKNHKPKYFYQEDVRYFNDRTDIPIDLYNLDILDGSPPCSAFSMAGQRELVWGRQKVFKEGQRQQTLDDLVFVYCETIAKLKPKVFILENVKGIISGNARAYSKEIVRKTTDAGYCVQVFCLDSSTMGVPQKRERVFFIGHKKEYSFPKLRLFFNEPPIVAGAVCDNTLNGDCLTEVESRYYFASKQGGSVGKFKSNKRYSAIKVAGTVTASAVYYHPYIPRKINNTEFCLIGSFPLDFDFQKIKPQYLIGMSVPPVMMAHLSYSINKQWLSLI